MNYYLIRARKSDNRKIESIIVKLLADRQKLCSITKSIEFASEPDWMYLVMQGVAASCKVVLGKLKNILTKEPYNLSFKEDFNLWSFDIGVVNRFTPLILGDECSLDGDATVYNRDALNDAISKRTTSFVIEHKLMSRHVFCSQSYCEGYCDAVSLTSLKGVYKCGTCGNEIEVDGPLLTGKHPITHLTASEQVYLLGFAEKEQEDKEPVSAEQMKWSQVSKLKKEKTSLKKKRKRDCKPTKIDKKAVYASIEQLSWVDWL